MSERDAVGTLYVRFNYALAMLEERRMGRIEPQRHGGTKGHKGKKGRDEKGMGEEGMMKDRGGKSMGEGRGEACPYVG